VPGSRPPVLENYEKRLKEMKGTTEVNPTEISSTKPKENTLQSTGMYLVPRRLPMPHSILV
jgi:hypothetical protein